MKIDYEKEVIAYLELPSIPRHEWTEENGKPFAKGVAVIELYSGREAYAVCSFNPDKGQQKPTITKVFSIEPFKCIKKILVVPDYMTSIDEVGAMDLDDESKKKAEQLLAEAEEIENEGVDSSESGIPSIDSLPEYIFPEIESREQALAWLRQYNKRNGIRKGKLPQTDETIKLRLYSIYSAMQQKANR